MICYLLTIILPDANIVTLVFDHSFWLVEGGDDATRASEILDAICWSSKITSINCWRDLIGFDAYAPGLLHSIWETLIFHILDAVLAPVFMSNVAPGFSLDVSM